ncbi:uncharacterized protein LY89DRAFT_754342 [Mollisia scopiformis]|uniref:Protein kinase domain-containing protein n=1 Tax=Mollisia scopiformis TaxID=149040 RepID=A0A194X008_MOLSC|nr:uncharacterized protein LY89DRAFT_754342 [Mollisia scopiformis]KUJ13531.1 hypothetical protein LY89DRAFT_754342 [Mollisia scopiformis]
MASANPPPDDPPLGNYGYDEKAVARGLSKRRQSEWLERSKKWPDLPARRWAARKVIGKGAYGICGQWDYTGNDKSMPRQIVVKQSIGSTAKILRGESKMMHLTTSTGADYVVKLYKGCHRGAGTGTSDIDPLPYNSLGMYIPHQEVVRMYMEYAPGGDLDAFFKRLIATPGARVIPEEHLWRLLHCLAKASMALGRFSLLLQTFQGHGKSWKCNFFA